MDCLDLFLNLIQNFLAERSQRVVLDGHTSEWSEIKAGFAKGSVHRSLFFSFSEIISKLKIFAGDFSLFSLIVDQYTLLP